MNQDLYNRIVDYIVSNQEKFYRLAYSYVHNQEDAMDIVQSAVCKALDHYGALRNENAIRTWFYRILVNESLLLIRKQKMEIPTEDGIGQDVPYYEEGYNGEPDIYGQLNQLDEDVQTIIKLRYFEELTLKEIAYVTSTNLNTVKARLYRGLRLLKQNIQEVDS
ncbi:sigma-70 family RNA polymerase sigma factor [Enterocloster sp. OA13]|uniref:Sigma-70 family RNA polymerase sigma factor n=1 Tax=Enterocloster hominis (ex Hitch et al. 2024) TaxID=1917870 RepID=A0ABV1D2Y8_9FIRM|nr:putative RNA polymerase sigma factor SigV [Clostridiales bacterium 1_7_47FAA]MCH1950271.1 sigma-70 family RNA polymerase sigma factor [Enterocloster sp. OA13]